MADQTVKLSSRGQLVIPAEMRRSLDLERGTRFEIEEKDGHLVLTPIRDEDWRSLRGCLESEKQDTSLTDALADERRRERERDDSALEDA
jgi:AbrB family looped-hinge helix DNA binding protein